MNSRLINFVAVILFSCAASHAQWDGPPLAPSSTGVIPAVMLDRQPVRECPGVSGDVRNCLLALTPEERSRSRIFVELSKEASPEAVSLAHEIETFWNSGSYEFALEKFEKLATVTGSDGLAIGVERNDPVAAPLERLTGVDVRVGSRDTVRAVDLEIDPANQHLVALMLFETDDLHGLAFYLSTNQGVTWREKASITANFVLADAALAVLNGIAYVAYQSSAGNDVRLRRFNTSDGYPVKFPDSTSDLSIARSFLPERVTEVALTSTQSVDGLVHRLYLSTITNQHKVKCYWNDPDTVYWESFSPTVTTASHGLSMAFKDPRAPKHTAPLWLSYFDTLNVMRIDSIGGDLGTQAHALSAPVNSGDATYTSISAYEDTILCAYEYLGNTNYCRYWISYGGGRESWKWGVVGGDSTVSSEAPAVTLERGGGMGMLYRIHTPTREMRFTWRNYPQGLWAAPIVISDYEPHYYQPAIVHMGGGKYGFLYLSWITSPIVQAAYFDTYDLATSVDNEKPRMPGTFTLEQNYPNPFNPVTTIKYTIGGAGEAGAGSGPSGRDSRSGGPEIRGPGARRTRLVVYDLLGRQVATLVDEEKAPATYEVSFEGRGLASGVYVYRLTAGSFVQSRKMVLLK